MFVKKLTNEQLDTLLDSIAILVRKRSEMMTGLEYRLLSADITGEQFNAQEADINEQTYALLKQLSLGLS